MTRRMTLIVLALLGLMVLVVTIAPPQRSSSGGSTASVTPAPSATPPLTDPDAPDVTETFSADPGVKPRTVTAQLGDSVQIVVQGSTIDSVALGDLGVEDIEPGQPAVFEWLADAPGTYPLVLTNENRRIGTLEVR